MHSHMSLQTPMIAAGILGNEISVSAVIMLKCKLNKSVRNKQIKNIKPKPETQDEDLVSEILGNKYLEYLVTFIHRTKLSIRPRRTLSFQPHRMEKQAHISFPQSSTLIQNVNTNVILTPRSIRSALSAKIKEMYHQSVKANQVSSKTFKNKNRSLQNK